MYPFKIIYLERVDSTENQVLISVSKKKFKKAVSRNQIKRKVKEAYRLNKHLLSDRDTASNKILIGYIYTGKEILPYKLVEAKLKKSLHRLMKELADQS